MVTEAPVDWPLAATCWPSCCDPPSGLEGKKAAVNMSTKLCLVMDPSTASSRKALCILQSFSLEKLVCRRRKAMSSDPLLTAGCEAAVPISAVSLSPACFQLGLSAPSLPISSSWRLTPHRAHHNGRLHSTNRLAWNAWAAGTTEDTSRDSIPKQL